jgi:hypothetical protein
MADFKQIVSGLNVDQREELDLYHGHQGDENGWKQLVAILNQEEVIEHLNSALTTALRCPPTSLGTCLQPSSIGFDRTAYNNWLEESLGLKVQL